MKIIVKASLRAGFICEMMKREEDSLGWRPPDVWNPEYGRLVHRSVLDAMLPRVLAVKISKNVTPRATAARRRAIISFRSGAGP